MQPSMRWNLAAGLYGNALEWFDFVIYASIAPLLATLFFPSNNVFVSLLATFGVFAIGFFVRPLGGVLLGLYSDRIGRRSALLASLSLMSLASLCIGLLPPFDKIGIFAPLLLTALRILQGLAIGGELPSATAYLIEILPGHRRCLAGSLPLSVAFLGILCGALTATILSTLLAHSQLLEYGWRLAFILAALLGLMGLYLRYHCAESKVFLEERDHTIKPLRELTHNYKTKLILGIFFTSILALGNYLLIAFTPSYLVKFGGLSLQEASLISFISLFVVTLLVPLSGFCADLIGKKPIFLFGVLGLTLTSLFIFWLLKQHTFALALTSQLILAFWLGPINGTVPTILSDMFTTFVRNTGISLSYNVGQAIFGGTAPLIAFLLLDLTHTLYSSGFYLMIISLLALFAASYYFRHPLKRAKPPSNCLGR
ncbi:MAG: hypothetical protein A3F10_06695 [Coxiella sp. RIFCSPHIGHO2_12_FULL_42_15]|nr:MAG: hypothetical protein A3F10_06695 [Coxiella sp. RIFCSPHIGHO2_12_FULL_42_15]